MASTLTVHSAPRRPIEVRWGRALLAFAATAVVVAVLTGIPTDVVPNDWFTRMTPVQSYAIPVWVTVSILSGVLAASHWGVTSSACALRGGGAAGGVGAVLSWLAIGCPICNKAVVLALGVSGALTYFAPLQPWLAAFSIALLLFSIASRWRSLLTAPPQARTGN